MRHRVQDLGSRMEHLGVLNCDVLGLGSRVRNGVEETGIGSDNKEAGRDMDMGSGIEDLGL